jgi:small subunit ribosomal protein S6
LAQNVYEGLFLLDSNRYARDPAGVSGQINKTLQEFGGEVLASRLWSEQKLAYAVNGQRKGTYWLAYFRLDSLRQTELNRALRLNENVLRNLILKVDPRLVETLVEHATGTEKEKEREKPVATAESTETVETEDAEAGSAEPAAETNAE